MGGNIARDLKDQNFTVAALFYINKIGDRNRRDCLYHTRCRHI